MITVTIAVSTRRIDIIKHKTIIMMPPFMVQTISKR